MKNWGILGFTGGSEVKDFLQCGWCGFDPLVGKILWRKEWQPTPVFLLGESPWSEEHGGLLHGDPKESDSTELLSRHATDLYVLLTYNLFPDTYLCSAKQ